eukprot:XP_011619165.1 PREDICTED: leukocyte elastase inhibitor-like [Takifugu rubripes]
MAAPSPLCKANTSFSLALFRKLSDNDTTANIFYSPFSISSALAMVLLGAQGSGPAQRLRDRRELEKRGCDNTAAQMSESLKTKGLEDDVHVSFSQLLNELHKENAPYALSVANRLYGEQSYQFVEDFLNSSKPVKMMHQSSKFPFTFIPEATCQVLELPYVGKELSMLIFLPKQIEDSTTGLEKLEKLLTYDNFMEWTRPDTMDVVKVQVGLPRFKMEEKCNMKNILVSMGMVDAFDVAASDFSGMSPANDLVLSEVIHKAFVEVNEEGTEAAAATDTTPPGTFCLLVDIALLSDH